MSHSPTSRQVKRGTPCRFGCSSWIGTPIAGGSLPSANVTASLGSSNLRPSLTPASRNARVFGVIASNGYSCPPSMISAVS